MATISQPKCSASFTNILMTDHQTVSRSRLALAESSLDVANPDRDSSAKCRVFLKKVFSKKRMERHVPILKWLPVYSKEDFVCDIIAGITVALAAIPLALAFADIAGLPTEFALYSSFVGNIIYTLFGSCKDNILGSTAIASLLTLQVAHGSWQKSILLTLITGVIELVMGLMRLGFIIDFVSGPVSAGFTSAVALIIFTSQIQNILVVKAGGESFLKNWILILKDIHNYSISDTILGVGSIVILLVLRYVGKIKIKAGEEKDLTSGEKFLNNFLWFLGVSRNALLVFVTAAVVGYMENKGLRYFQLTGFIPSGFPQVKVPSFSIAENETENVVTESVVVSFWGLLQEFGTGLLVIPLISLLETIAVCRTFSNGKPVDTNQEIITLGLANIVNSFFQGYRINGGLARGSVNTASGGRTQFVNVYISVIVILALIFLAEYFFFIPKATLAAIIIAAVLFQLQYQTIIPMWKSKKSDLFIGLLAFVACLVLSLGLGITLAIGVNVLYVLYHSARPQISVDLVTTRNNMQFLKLTPDRCLIFPSMEFVRNKILKSGQRYTIPVVFDCTYIFATDFTTAKVIETIVHDFKARNQTLIFYNLRPKLLKVFDFLQAQFVVCYTLDCIEKLLDDDCHAIANSVADKEVTKL